MKKIFVAAFALLGFLPFASAQTGTWSGDLEVQGMKFSLVFHFEEENPTLDIPDQGAMGLPMSVSRTDAGEVTVNVPTLNATFKGQLQDGKIPGTFTQMGASLPFTLTPGVKKLNRPQTPQGPFPYAQEEVSFANGDAVLQGTLTLPEGVSRKTPVLIMVTGSGQQNRDEEIFEHKPFAVLADALARAGVATLRYDDRGFGASTGNAANADTDDFKEDALAGIKFLRGRFDKVGVIGHSEGGTIALMLAAEQQADFIVSLAGMAISGEETLIWQTDLALIASGVAQEHVEKYNALLREAYEALRAGKDLPSPEGRGLPPLLMQSYYGVIPQLQTPYLKRFIDLDMRPLLGKISCPVLALNGTVDQQVEPESNLGALREGLKGNPKAVVEAVEGVNHLFQHSATGQMTEYREIEETFAPEALRRVVEWGTSL